MNDLVSVIVPVYNAAACIADTILSVKRQTYTNWELLLCDDNSMDDSVKIMTSFADERVKVIPHNPSQKGAAFARNRGIAAASGRYICFLDADDLWLEDKLTEQVEYMKQSGVAFSFTGYEFADENGVGTGTIVRVPEKIAYNQALCNTTIFTSTVMFDMNVLTKDDIYMPNVKSEDTATWWRLLRKLDYAYGIDKPYTLYRRAGKSLSSNKLVAIGRIWNLYRNVEHLSIIKSCYCFCGWAVRAVLRRV